MGFSNSQLQAIVIGLWVAAFLESILIYALLCVIDARNAALARLASQPPAEAEGA